MNASALILLIASHKSLTDYYYENVISSPFFNLAQTLNLGKINKNDANKITFFLKYYQNIRETSNKFTSQKRDIESRKNRSKKSR